MCEGESHAGTYRRRACQTEEKASIKALACSSKCHEAGGPGQE